MICKSWHDTRCPGSGLCVNSITECDNPCIGTPKPYRCSNFTCVATPRDCRDASHSCPFECWNGLCAAAPNGCEEVPSCPSNTYRWVTTVTTYVTWRCYDGSCLWDCTGIPQFSCPNGVACTDAICLNQSQICTSYDGCGLGQFMVGLNNSKFDSSVSMGRAFQIAQRVMWVMKDYVNIEN